MAQTFGGLIFGGKRFGGPVTVISASFRAVHIASKTASFHATTTAATFSAKKT